MTKLSWEETERILDKLSNKIKASGFEPDYIEYSQEPFLRVMEI